MIIAVAPTLPVTLVAAALIGVGYGIFNAGGLALNHRPAARQRGERPGSRHRRRVRQPRAAARSGARGPV
ncbi:MAG TPA: hypothetical protein VIT65_24300 [Microlunatus sp.]